MTIGQILVLAGVIAVAVAAALDHFGVVGGNGSLPFVGTLVCAKLGLFTFWPEIKELRTVSRKSKKPQALALWDEKDPRVDVALFSATVPTFVLNAEQRFLDWNPAFSLAFGDAREVVRGAHISVWFKHLDNFRRVPKRTDKLYGEGILPITDRERVTYLSKRFGRMVFTKIMSPIVDRGSGRIIGWTVVLNINSVNKRNEFFERLFARIALENKRIRYAASHDGLFEHYAPRTELIDAHVEALGDAERILDMGTGTGAVAMALLRQGHKVTAVDGDLHQLRRLKDQILDFESNARIVRQDMDDLKNLPEERFDGAVLCESLHRAEDPQAVLAAVARSLKPGAILSISARLDGIDPLFNSLRVALEAEGRFDNLKHQFNHVMEFEREMAAAKPYRFWSREELRAALLGLGFTIQDEAVNLQDGHTLLLKAGK